MPCSTTAPTSRLLLTKQASCRPRTTGRRSTRRCSRRATVSSACHKNRHKLCAACRVELARKQGMDIVTQAGEADAWLKLPPADAASHMSAVFQQRVALFDSALKRQLANARRIARALKSGTASRALER